MYFYCDDTVGIQYAVDIVWSVNSRCSKRRATDALKLVHGLGLGINQVISIHCEHFIKARILPSCDTHVWIRVTGA